MITCEDGSVVECNAGTLDCYDNSPVYCSVEVIDIVGEPTTITCEDGSVVECNAGTVDCYDGSEALCGSADPILGEAGNECESPD